MVMLLSLNHCGVVIEGSSKDGTVLGPHNQKDLTSVTDCGSVPLLIAVEGQSRATGL